MEKNFIAACVKMKDDISNRLNSKKHFYTSDNSKENCITMLKEIIQKNESSS